MFDLGMTELLVVGVVALIVVGPKDLPMLFRNVGRFVGQAKAMAREFSSAMESAADESGVKDAKQAFKMASNPLGAMSDSFKQATADLDADIDSALDVDMGVETRTYAPDSETGKIAIERAENAKKIKAASARAAAERKAREAQDALAKAEQYEAELSAVKPEVRAQDTVKNTGPKGADKTS